MKLEMIVNADNMTKEDLRAFIQTIREWELRTPKSQIVGILFNTDPQMSSQETADIFRGIFPEYKHLVEIGKPELAEKGLHVTVEPTEGSTLRLGWRGISVDGELIGTVDELTMSFGEVGEADIKKLQEANVIQLVKIAKG